MSGVMLRGSGVRFDLRKNKPYEIYDDLTFEIPVAYNGDCLDRYSIRVEEMRQSVSIIHQVISKMPAGTIRPDDSKIMVQSRRFFKETMEGTIDQFKNYTDFFKLKARDESTTIEAPKGEFGVYLAGTDAINVNRCRIKAPGFFHLQSVNMMTQKHLIADVVTVIGTQDIVFGEVDR